MIQKEPIKEVYKIAKEKYNINERTMQWYASDGLIPKPIHEGKEAYYDIEESRIYDYLYLIEALRFLYNLSLYKIRDIFRKYKNNISLLRKKIEILADKYPRTIIEMPYDFNALMREKVLELIEKGKDLKEINFLDIEAEIERPK